MPKCQAENQIRKRVQMEKDRQKIDKLCLDQIPLCNFTPIIKRMLQSCINLEYLTINACSLKSLSNFPKLPALITLQLSGNQLSGELQFLHTSRYITFLDLSDNHFQRISELTPLASLSELQILILGQNPVAEQPGYRQQIFAFLPTLTMIDCYDRDDNLVSSSEQQSYITDKYHSLNNLDELYKEKEANGNGEIIRSRESLVDPDQIRLQRNKSLQRLGLKTALNKRQKKRKRFAQDCSSEEEGSNQMIKQFNRKFQKEK